MPKVTANLHQATDEQILREVQRRKLEAALRLSDKEAHLVREWFDSVQDLSPDYLEPRDYKLAEKVYKAVEMRVPHNVQTNSLNS